MKKIKINITCIVIAIACVSIYLTRQHNQTKLILFSDIEALSNPEIDYGVKDAKNDPKSCILSVLIKGTGVYDHSGAWIEARYEKSSGIVNVCKASKGDTCDPYNCHKRVL